MRIFNVIALARLTGAIGVFERREFNAVQVPEGLSADELTRALIQHIHREGYEIQAIVRVIEQPHG